MAALTFPTPTQLKNIGDPTANTDAATKYYVDQQVSTGNAAFANNAGTVTASSQPNITSVGNLVSLNVIGNITAGNINGGNVVTANFFVGNGSLLTGISATTSANANYANYAGNAFSITGSNVSGQVGNALLAGTVYTNAQPNITSVGTLTDLSVSGNAVISGNLVVGGNTTYINVETLVIEDPVIELGSGVNGAPLTSNDGKDRGTLLHYYTTGAVDAFMGWDNSNAEFAFGSNVSVSSEVVTFNNLGNVRASYFIGNGSQLTGISATTSANANYANYAGNAFSVTGSNVSGQVANALVTGTVYTNAQPNITSVGTLTSLDVTGNVTAGNIVTGGGTGGNITGANVISANTLTASGNITASNANLGNAVVANYFVGNLYGTANLSTYATTANAVAGSNVSGNVGNALNAYAVAGANVSGQVSNALIAGTVYTAAQPNITSVGTLTSLAVSGTSNLGPVGNVTITGGTNGQYLQTNGSGVLSWSTVSSGATSNISNGNSNVNIPNANGNVNISAVGNANVVVITGTGVNVTGTLNATGDITAGNIVTGGGTGGNITGANVISANTLTASGNISASNANLGNAVVANYFVGNLYGTANLATYATTANAVAGGNVSGQVANALVAGTVYTNAQPNITSVGTLTELSVSGNAVISGNLVVGGNTTYINVETLVIEDPVIELGSGVNGAPLTNNDGKDRGTLLHYYTSAPVDAFMGWDNSNAEFAFGSNVSVSGEVVTFNSLGNVRASYFMGNGSQLTGITASTGNANYANYAGNAFSVSGSNVTGAVAYATTANAVAGSNVSGQVANALVASTVYTNAQPNITSVGTLTSLDVTGNITSGNANLGNATTSNYFIGNLYGTANLATYATTANAVAGANVSGQVANALVAGTVYTNAQPNITSVGTLTSLIVSGTSNLGPVSNVTITGGSNGQYLQTDGAGLLTWSTVSSGSASNITNGNSNVNITTANGNITLSASGNSNIMTVTGTGVNVAGTLDVTGNVSLSGPNISLGSVSNLHISGGTANYVLSTDGTGNLAWSEIVVPSFDIAVDNFTGNGVQANYTLTNTPANINCTIVSIAGLFQPRTVYSVTGNVVTFSSAPSNTAPIEITTFISSSSGGGGGGGGGGYTYVEVTANTTASANTKCIVNTNTSNLTVTLPSSPTLGTEIGIIDGTGNASVHAITIGRNGSNIQGAASNMTVTTDRAAFTLVYYNASQGWILTNV